ncbi:MAG: DNA adenine methylase [Marichromatium sp.]|nr:DNA adenine methylase [Marichromatium sp.]
MVRSTSPLRYPGGKTCLYPLASKILRINKLERCHYAEPFAGGCGLALALLYEGHVSDIHINDIDASIWAFWHSVLEHTEELTQLVQKTPVTFEEWRRQREIHLKMDAKDPVSLGFATFFLNRTNRSGIIKAAGVIGGKKQQGLYKIDCRFNRDDLVRRIRRIAKYKNSIHLTNMDALDFLQKASCELLAKTFYCVDPPYFLKGKGLYTSFYKPQDHAILAEKILSLKSPWIVTYDNVPETIKLYKSRRQYEFDISYSVETKRRGTELMIASKNLKIPDEIQARQVNKPRY